MADPTPTQPADQARAEATREKLDNQRVAFGNTIKNYFPVLFILTVVIATSLIALCAIGFFLERTMDATVLAASVQVAFGMVLGFVCVYIGLMMTWIGIDAAYSVQSDLGAASFVLKSASPGLLFALGGIVLVSVSLHKQIVYEEHTGKVIDTQPLDTNAKRNGIMPRSPDSVIVMPAGGNASAGAQTSGVQAIPSTSFSGQIQVGPTQPRAANREEK